MTEHRHGTVHETGGGVYAVALDDGGTIEASLRGRLKQQTRTGSRVVIGDRVVVAESGDAWTIDTVDARTTELVRRGRGGRAAKILAANLDRVFAVVSLRAPVATASLIDRILVLIESSGMHPTLVLNKAELEGAAEAGAGFAEIYESVGYGVLVTSAETGLGMDEFHREICSGSSALIGPSGVGKSSLLNRIEPGLALRIGAVSERTGTGRHTTVGSRLIALECGGYVADTPGFGDVGLWAVEPRAVAHCFPEFARFSDQCRFRECTHVHEPDCGVLEAIEQGAIHRSRHASYVALREEAEAAAPKY
jgi:ribosome biogenesis GTPase